MTSPRTFASRRSLWLSTLFACLTAGGAAVPVHAASGEDDWEGFNRKVFVFNDKVDEKVLKPVAKGYVRVTPDPLERGIGNLFDNLRTPATALNQFLQGKPKAGINDVGRFLLNSTVGILGLFDVASRAGLDKHEEDFGQTFRAWGVGAGPFVMLPFLGPSTTTDTVGRVLDAFTNPVMLISPSHDRYAFTVVDIIDTRAALLSAEELISGDKYLFIRDAYLQRRDYLVSDGTVEDDPFLDEEWDDEEWDDEEYDDGEQDGDLGD